MRQMGRYCQRVLSIIDRIQGEHWVAFGVFGVSAAIKSWPENGSGKPIRALEELRQGIPLWWLNSQREAASKIGFPMSRVAELTVAGLKKSDTTRTQKWH